MDRFSDRDPLWSQLRTAPLVRSGFDSELRSRIEKTLADESVSVRWRFRPARFTLFGGAALFAILAVVVALHVDIAPEAGQAFDNFGHGNGMAPVSKEGETVLAVPQVEPESGLLLGLRRDRLVAETGLHLADYRTLWIAPDGDRLAVKTEGSGLIVPYRLDFWSVDATTEVTGNRALQFVTADFPPVPGRADRVTVRDAQLYGSEQVTFVGNRYIGIEQTGLTRVGDGWMSETTHVVATLDDVRSREFRPLPLVKFVGNAESSASEALETTDWTPVRHGGRWVPQVDGQLRESLHLSAELVSHDKPCRPWEDIARWKPDAKDAVCSPLGDMLALITREEVIVFPMAPQENAGISGKHEAFGIGVGGKALKIPLRDGEKLVMAQWATLEYVGKWDEWTERLLD